MERIMNNYYLNERSDAWLTIMQNMFEVSNNAAVIRKLITLGIIIYENRNTIDDTIKIGDKTIMLTR